MLLSKKVRDTQRFPRYSAKNNDAIRMIASFRPSYYPWFNHSISTNILPISSTKFSKLGGHFHTHKFENKLLYPLFQTKGPKSTKKSTYPIYDLPYNWPLFGKKCIFFENTLVYRPTFCQYQAPNFPNLEDIFKKKKKIHYYIIFFKKNDKKVAKNRHSEYTFYHGIDHFLTIFWQKMNFVFFSRKYPNLSITVLPKSSCKCAKKILNPIFSGLFSFFAR